MRLFLSVFLFPLVFTISLLGSLALADGQLLGFDETTSTVQHELETVFDSHIDRTEMDEWLREFSSEAHHVGSPKGKKNADALAALFRSWNYAVEISEYQVLFSEPLTRELELLYPYQFTASLTEDSLEEDPSTSVIDNLLPPYNAFSNDGEDEG